VPKSGLTDVAWDSAVACGYGCAEMKWRSGGLWFDYDRPRPGTPSKRCVGGDPP